MTRHVHSFGDSRMPSVSRGFGCHRIVVLEPSSCLLPRLHESASAIGIRLSPENTRAPASEVSSSTDVADREDKPVDGELEPGYVMGKFAWASEAGTWEAVG